MIGDPFYPDEKWEELEEFPRYMISTVGRIYNKNTNRQMKCTVNNFGHLKISLLNDTGRHTRSVALLVAQAFVQKPNIMCDHVIYLNGNTADVRIENLAWRPRWFGWKYSRQLKGQQPAYFRSLPVRNVSTGQRYANIEEAGMAEGLLFEHIWHSTHTESPCFPNGTIWVVEA